MTYTCEGCLCTAFTPRVTRGSLVSPSNSERSGITAVYSSFVNTGKHVKVVKGRFTLFCMQECLQLYMLVRWAIPSGETRSRRLHLISSCLHCTNDHHRNFSTYSLRRQYTAVSSITSIIKLPSYETLHTLKASLYIRLCRLRSRAFQATEWKLLITRKVKLYIPLTVLES